MDLRSRKLSGGGAMGRAAMSTLTGTSCSRTSRADHCKGRQS